MVFDRSIGASVPVEGPQDAGQLTVATRCRAFRLASVGGHLRFSYCPASAPSSLGHKPSQLCGKMRRFAGPSYARQSYTGAYAFLTVQLRHPALWVISHPSCAAKCAASPVRLMPGRATRAPTLFLLSSFCSQPLESLQPFQTW